MSKKSTSCWCSVARTVQTAIALADIGQATRQAAYLIDTAKDIRHDWFKAAETVLVTAGASAPEENVQEVVQYLKERFGATVETRTIREEHVSFPLPRELRSLTLLAE